MLRSLIFLVIVIFAPGSRCELIFPKDFNFGVGTSAFQIEGGWNASEKSPSIWDHKSHYYPEQILDNETADVACNSYHKLATDIKMIRELGVDSYRFSLSWTRILPNGFSNRINPYGIRYYNTLINELLRYNITPMVTIYHWDLPQTFAGMGGWLNPAVMDYFVDFADIAFKNFGDRVKFWTTLNEPHMFCEFDYIVTYEEMAINNPIAPYLCANHALKAHAKAYHLYKTKYADQQGTIGIVLDSQWYIPKSNSTLDKLAAKRALSFNFDWFAHPIFSKTGDYPPAFKERIAHMSKQERFPRSKLPILTAQEIRDLRGSSDYLGLNHYNSYKITAGGYTMYDRPNVGKDQNVTRSLDPSWPITDNGWGIVPEGFYHLIMYIKNEYGNPDLYITENGCSDKAMNDKKRQLYIMDYLQSMSDAIRHGANVKGYCSWSLMDNFEWFSGYTEKFGLYHVNFTDPNRKRTPRQSVFLYHKIIQHHKQRHFGKG